VTEQELQAIKERANAASNAPWIVEAGEYSGNNWLVGTITVNFGESYRDYKVYFVTTKSVHASELEGDAKTDAEFIAHARADVPALLTEVRSLRAMLDAVPVAAIGTLFEAYGREGYRFGYLPERNAIAAWLAQQEPQESQP